MNELINQERGKLLFNTKINAAMEIADSTTAERLKHLSDTFEVLVGVMPVGGCFGAARISKVCIDIANDSSILKEKLIDTALESYAATATTSNIKRSDIPGQLIETREATTEEHNADPQREEKHIMFEEMNNMIKFSTGDSKTTNIECAECLDIIQDMPANFLELEGKRSRGLIPADYDITSDQLPIVKEEAVLRVHLSYRDTLPEIHCPICKSNNILISYDDNCECLDCEVEFILEYEVRP